MDAREQLKRYLEQRREAGERDLVLDHLSVSDALRLIGAAPATAKRPQEQSSSDWREVLRNAGAAPEAGSGEREAGSATREAGSGMRDATSNAAPPPASHFPLPANGLSVGDADRELFGGTLAHLDSLDAVARTVATCTRCPLYATATNPVPGQGNPNADLMIVGEAPGATEDEQGLAFVGAAGQLLTKILAAVNLRREDVFICNVLKHRPPGNRNPMPDEVTACRPYLVRQFELIRPKAILALGAFAAQTLLQTKLAVGKLRSQMHRYYGVPLIVTYHPAALLRDPKWKRFTWEDVQLVRRILDSSAAKS
ncbi:MAG TPA: uracil-DNA glycosylase [Gemmatimonadaceae bacterium]